MIKKELIAPGIVRRASEQIYTRYQLYFARCNYYQIVNLTSVQSMKVVQKYFGECLIKYKTSFILFYFSLPKLSLCFKCKIDLKKELIAPGQSQLIFRLILNNN